MNKVSTSQKVKNAESLGTVTHTHTHTHTLSLYQMEKI